MTLLTLGEDRLGLLALASGQGSEAIDQERVRLLRLRGWAAGSPTVVEVVGETGGTVCQLDAEAGIGSLGQLDRGVAQQPVHTDEKKRVVRPAAETVPVSVGVESEVVGLVGGSRQQQHEIRLDGFQVAGHGCQEHRGVGSSYAAVEHRHFGRPTEGLQALLQVPRVVRIPLSLREGVARAEHPQMLSLVAQRSHVGWEVRTGIDHGGRDAQRELQGDQAEDQAQAQSPRALCRGADHVTTSAFRSPIPWSASSFVARRASLPQDSRFETHGCGSGTPCPPSPNAA